MCNSGYYNNESICNKCSSNCKECDMNGCILCEDNYQLNKSNYCVLITNCSQNEYNKCYQCNEGYYSSSKECNLLITNCLYQEGNECKECQEPKYLNNNTCGDTNNEFCMNQTSKGCLRCKDGFYLDENNNCQQCDLNCKTCFGNSTFCTSCSDEKYMKDNHCESNKELEKVCNKVTNDGTGCVICKDGYYREGLICKECLSECSKCNNPNNCLACNEEHFMTINGECKLKNETQGCVGEISSSSGCSSCDTSYYLKERECYQCPNECSTCTKDECTTCEDDYVLLSDKCIHYKNITNCKSAKDSKCNKCTFWHKPNEEGTECRSHAEWWIILIGVVLVITIIIIIIALIVILISHMSKKKKQKELAKTVCLFKMKNSNIKFDYKISNLVKSNIQTLDLEDDLPVNKETRELICLGNSTSNKIKVQFVMMNKLSKFSIRTNPEVIIINKGEACEFEIFITPICTCTLDEKLTIVSVDIKKGQDEFGTIGIKAQTEMSTRLDPDELHEDKKLGEGSFGIVFKGTFRGNEVAIKRMKEAADNDEQMEEFNKEVAMLDKFRDPYIVHFYGAVFIPSKICMVTEFATHGSLQDVMKHHEAINEKVRIKILLDAAKGIEYLHNNGILHRDIKPDNILIFDIEHYDNSFINGKLTDFGASRNVNILMTNITFTKGIGTPKFMAPEVLEQEHYKKPADIYSFAITMFETMKWGSAYPKEIFRYEWDIAEFICKGKRLNKTNKMRDQTYDLITHCWQQDPKERLTIDEIIQELNKLE